MGWQWHEPALPVLILVGALYGLGLARLWGRAGVGRGIGRRQASSFLLGLAVLLAALVSPLAPLGHHAFSAHMTQHMLLVLVAAPLLAYGAPLLVGLWLLPVASRRSVMNWLGSSGLGRLARAASSPVAALVLFGALLWLWHLPVLYVWALWHPAAHALEHLTLLGSATLFWWYLLQPMGRRRLDLGLAALFALATLLHTSLLGALLTFAPAPLYWVHTAGRGLFGLDPLSDQQLAGLIMWVPMGVVLGAQCTGSFGRWLRGLGHGQPG